MLESIDNLYAIVAALVPWVAVNLAQVIGTLTGVGGALLLAVKCRYSSWAWPIWIVSNVAWAIYALQMPDIAYGLIVQQVVFGVINIVGTWTWLLRRQPTPLAANGST